MRASRDQKVLYDIQIGTNGYVIFHRTVWGRLEYYREYFPTMSSFNRLISALINNQLFVVAKDF